MLKQTPRTFEVFRRYHRSSTLQDLALLLNNNKFIQNWEFLDLICGKIVSYLLKAYLPKNFKWTLQHSFMMVSIFKELTVTGPGFATCPQFWDPGLLHTERSTPGSDNAIYIIEVFMKSSNFYFRVSLNGDIKLSITIFIVVL